MVWKLRTHKPLTEGYGISRRQTALYKPPGTMIQQPQDYRTISERIMLKQIQQLIASRLSPKSSVYDMRDESYMS